MNGVNGHGVFLNAAAAVKVVFLDSTPLGLLGDPKKRPIVQSITSWADAMVAAGHTIYVPEIIDYELRRELLRAGKTQSVAELANLQSRYRYAPLTTAVMLRAADLWATLRNNGLSTGDPKKLDIDVILAAQALTEGGRLGIAPSQVVVATSNVAHLSRMISADLWQNIVP